MKSLNYFNNRKAPGFDCLYNSIKTIIDLNNIVVVQEADLILLSNFLNIQYDGDFPNIDVKLQSIISSLSNNGIVLQKLDVTNTQSLEEILKREFLLGHIDTTYLSYNDIYIRNKGRSHIIVLLEVNNDDLFIYDGHIRNYSGTEVFAGNTRKEILKYFNDIYVVKYTQMPTLNKSILTHYMLKSIETYLNSGLNSQINFIRDISLIAEYNDQEFENACIDINYIIKIDLFVNVLEKTVYCLNHINYSNQENLCEIKKLIDLWSLNAMLILRCGITKQRNSLKNYIDKSLDILNRQKILMEKLYCDLLQICDKR